MKRRAFITLLGGAAAMWPLAARAQQMPVVGFLGTSSADSVSDLLRAFHQGLAETGFTEGRNVALEYRWAEGKNERMPALANDLVSRNVTVIAASTTPAAQAAKAATAVIPTVFVTGTDPVAAKLVTGLSQPGGNLTGVTFLGVELTPKRLELLRELVPMAKAIALLVNPTSPTQADAVTTDALDVARALGLRLHVLRATERELDTVFETMVQLQVEGLVIGPDANFTTRSKQIASLTLRHRLPAIYQWREFVTGGGLMSYGSSITDSWRLMGTYTGRILKGEKPGTLPVQQATKAELIVNLKTAKALGINMPLPLLGRADEVIE